MAKESQVPIVTSSAQPRELSKTRLEVNAAPVDRTVITGRSSTSQLAEALSKASPGFQRYLQGKQDEYAESEMAKGVRDAQLSEGDVELLIKDGQMNREQSPYYQKAFIEQAGVLKGYDKWRQLYAEYETSFDKDTGDINQFLGERLQADMQGLEDPDFAKGFLSVIAEKEQLLRQEHLKHVVTQQKIETRQRYTQLLHNRFSDMRQGLVDREVIDALASQGQKLGLSNQEIMQTALEAATLAYKDDEGKVYPEVFEVFRSGDVGIGKMWSNPQFAQDIESLYQGAIKTRKAQDSIRDNVAYAEVLESLEPDIQNGTLTWAKIKPLLASPENPNGLSADKAAQLVSRSKGNQQDYSKRQQDYNVRLKLAAVSQGNIPYEGETLEDIITNVYKDSSLDDSSANQVSTAIIGSYGKIAEQQGIQALLSQGDYVNAVTQFSEAKVKKAVSTRYDQIRAQAGDEGAFETVLTDVSRSHHPDAIPTQIKEFVSNASPSDPQAFTQAFSQWRRLKTVSPKLTDDVSGSQEQERLFVSYQFMTEQMGRTPEQATASLNEFVSNPDASKDINTIVSFDKGKDRLQKLVKSEFGSSGNHEQMVVEAERYAKYLLAVPADIRPSQETAFEAAIEYLDRTYVKSGDQRVPIRNPYMRTPDYPKASQWMVEKIAEQAGEGASPDGYALLPSSTDPNKLHVVEMTMGVPGAMLDEGKVIDVSSMIREYQIDSGKLLTGDALRKEVLESNIEQLQRQVTQFQRLLINNRVKPSREEREAAETSLANAQKALKIQQGLLNDIP